MRTSQAELLKRFGITEDDPLAPSLIMIDGVTKQLESSASRASRAAERAAGATYEAMMAEILDRITESQLGRAQLRGILIASALIIAPIFASHFWLKLDYDTSVDAVVASRLAAVPSDVRDILQIVRNDPEAKRKLEIIEKLERSTPGFSEWVTSYGQEAYELFTYNGDKACPIRFQFRSGRDGCAFLDPFNKLLSP